MLSALWGRITGKDKRKKYPEQQAVFLGRVGDYAVLMPYGLYADLPNDTLLKEIADGVAVPMTVTRPSDTEQGEPTFFHPSTNTRIIARNNGDLDIITDDGTAGSVNIQTVNANITASGNVTADITGNLSATIGGDSSISATGNVDISAANMTATITTLTLIDCPAVQFTGNVQIDGTLTVTSAAVLPATVTSAGTNIGGSHYHTQAVDSNGDSQANTSTPI